MAQTALIMGASGKFGSQTADALQADGWTIRNYNRAEDTPERAAEDADLIVNAMNPAGYANWEKNIPAITDLALRAARSSGAAVIVPGNVYNFASGHVWGPESPQDATTRKGRLRVQMEDTYRAAAQDGVQVIILRAGDFLYPNGEGTWFDMAITKDLAKGRIGWPGRRDIPHAFAYLPDLVRGAAALAAIRSNLPAFNDIPFPGYTLTGDEVHRILEVATGKSLKRAAFPWWFMRLASPVWPLAREVLEMRYLWDYPHALNGAAFEALLPEFRHTAAADAITMAAGLA